MAVIFNNIDRVANNPQVTAIVKIELLFDDNDSPVAKNTSTETMIQGFHKEAVDSDGYWQRAVVPNSNITPTDNIYKVTETITEVDGTTSSVSYYINVPDAASPYFWTGSIIVNKPGWL